MTVDNPPSLAIHDWICKCVCMCMSRSIDRSVSQSMNVCCFFFFLLFSFSYSVRQSNSNHWRGGVEDALFRFSPLSSWSCVCMLPHCRWKISIYIYISSLNGYSSTSFFLFSFQCWRSLVWPKKKSKRMRRKKKIYTQYACNRVSPEGEGKKRNSLCIREPTDR